MLCGAECAIGDEGGKALAAALEKNATLTKLQLDGNSVGDVGASALASALEKNTTLTELGLAWNSVGEAGASALASALEKNATLRCDDARAVRVGHGAAEERDALSALLKAAAGT